MRSLKIIFLAWTIFLVSSKSIASTDTNTLRRVSLSDHAIETATLVYLSSLRPHGINYGKLLFKEELKLELWDRRSERLYFSTPRNLPSRIESITLFLRDPKDIRIASKSGRRLELDGKSLTQTKSKVTLFSTSRSNFTIDSERDIEIKFGELVFKFTPRDLALTLNNAYIHGGKLRVSKVPDGYAAPKFLNHGAMVSQIGDPILSPLVEQITRTHTTVEEKIQQLLNFTTKTISYDERDFYFGREFLQRAPETLIGGTGDCSNLSILFASLLEQIAIEYVLVYTNNHIYVGVPQGEFSTENGLYFSFNGRNWAVAETTVRGFQIGQTRIKDVAKLSQIKFLQNPSEKNILYDFSTGKALMFN